MMIPALRSAVVGVLVVATVVLQATLFSHLSFGGVVPDLALIVVIAAALVRGPEYAAVVGFVAGLVLDLAPPADHTAGRWALSLVLVGYLTGLARPEGETGWPARVLMVAAGAFIGTSLFALSGLVLGDPGVSVASALEVVPRAIAYDLLVAPLALPLMLLVFRRLQPLQRW